MTVPPPVPPPVPGADEVVDARGLVCPLPVIRLARAVAEAAVGSVVAVLADDPAAAVDVPAWCRLRGQSLEGTQPVPGGTAYLVRRVS